MPAQNSAADPERSDVIVFPPLIPLTGFLLGLVIDFFAPSSAYVPAPLRFPLRCLGVLVFVIGAAGFAWMVRTMKKERTPIHNAKAPTLLVQSGPFRFTRNPMYLFGSIAYAGLALLLIKLWCLALLPVVLLLTHYGVVLREETFLERRFGDPYNAYRRNVRRWL